MNPRLLLPALILLALTGLSAPKGDTKVPARKDPLADLARNIVSQSAKVREGDLVHLTGTPSDVRLLEQLAVQSRAAGAHPLITLTSDRLRRRFFDDVPAKFDKQPPKFDLALAGIADVLIGMEATDESALLGVAPERMTVAQKASEGVARKLLSRNVRTVWLGNGLYPTATRAKRFGLEEGDLRKLYEAGLSADSSKMQAVGAKLRKTLASGKVLHLTSPAGTDLKMKITARPVLVSDGILTAEKEKKGGAACLTWLPAGEVYVTPVPSTAEGKSSLPWCSGKGRKSANWCSPSPKENCCR